MIPALLAVGLMLMGGCAKSPVEKLIDESIGHFEAAHRMLVDNAGNIEKLGIAVVVYRSKHRGEFRRLRLAGESALKALPEAERKAVMAGARKRTLALVQSIETAAARYKQKRIAMRVVRPLMVTATPRGLARGQRAPWLPKFNEIPKDQGAKTGSVPPPHTMGGHQHGHGHGLPPASTGSNAP